MGKQQQQQKPMWLGIKLPGTAGLLGANRLKNFCFLKELRSEEILLWKTVQWVALVRIEKIDLKNLDKTAFWNKKVEEAIFLNWYIIVYVF